MDQSKKLDFAGPAPPIEDAETLAAIDEGIRDAEAGLVFSIEEIRERLPQWITASASRKER